MSYHYVSLLKLNVSYYEISLLNTLKKFPETYRKNLII